MHFQKYLILCAAQYIEDNDRVLNLFFQRQTTIFIHVRLLFGAMGQTAGAANAALLASHTLNEVLWQNALAGLQ